MSFSENKLDMFAEIIKRSFSNDSVMRWFFSESWETHALEYFRRQADRVNAIGEIDSIGEEAVALWVPPGVSLDTGESKRLYKYFAGNRAEPLTDAIESLKNVIPRPDYLYLHYIASLERGKGIGRKLFQRRSYRDYPVFLISTNKRNLSFYNRLGFEKLGAIPIGHTGLQLFPMWLDV